MDNTETLTLGEQYSKQQLEALKAYFELAYKVVYHFGFYAPESIDELMEIILADELELADMTNIPIGSLFDFRTESMEICKFFDKNTQKFDAENYFPLFSNKDVGDGAWIKVKATNGFEIHWAKKAKRVRRFNEEMEVAVLNEDKKQIQTLYIYEKIKTFLKISPYEIVIKKSKYKREYLMPYEYEIIEDIEGFITAHLQETEGLRAVNIFNADNADQVFYLQSRGIPKHLAQVMGSLKNIYFKIDLKAMHEAFHNSYKIQLIQQMSA
jgi:hypothetical protein